MNLVNTNACVVGAVELIVELTKIPAKVAAHRQSTGRCAHCGYDLRATRDRCPECGHSRETPAAPVALT